MSILKWRPFVIMLIVSISVPGYSISGGISTVHTWGKSAEDRCAMCHSTINEVPDGLVVCSSCHDGSSGSHALTGKGSHPVGMRYLFRAGYRSIQEIESRGAYVQEGRVVCISCHDPHKTDEKFLLRIKNIGSMLCFACHDI